MDITGKTVIVTGASRGIGKQVALELARRGANIAIAARTVERRKQLPGTIGETLEQLEAVGAKAIAVQADLTAETDLAKIVDKTVEAFGGVDVLVNNAAATGHRAWGAPLLDLSRADFLMQYEVNLFAPFTLIQRVAPIMADRGGGRVINLTTASPEVFRQNNMDPGSVGSARQTAVLGPAALGYTSSKAALDRFCAVVAPQLNEMGISISNVHPGSVRTELSEILGARGMDISNMIPTEIPTKAIAWLATCDDPMANTGRLFVAERLVADLGL